MKRKWVLLLLVMGLVIIVGSLTFSRGISITGNIISVTPNIIGGFPVRREIRFDESMGGTKPTPRIPKSWRFVGVSNGSNVNSNNLWFQDKAGNIYLVRGFTSTGTGQFTLQEGMQKINVGN